MTTYTRLAKDQQVTYGAHVVTPNAYVLQPRIDIVIQPPFDGDTWIAAYGGDLFSCSSHCQSCLFAWCCMPGATGKIAGFGNGPTPDHQPEDGCSCVTHCMGQFLCPFCWPCIGANARGMLEERIAAFHGEPPASAPCGCGICGDVLLHFFCGCCATAQSLRAIKMFNHMHGGNVGGVDTVEMVR